MQVKTLRRSNCYLLNLQNVKPDHIYLFVLLHNVGQPVEYFPISGREMIEREFEIFGPKGGRPKMSGITMGRIRPFKDNWQVFEE